MKKIRINELARELEVKPGAIIDLLNEYGVEEKKTHSSSIDEDVALLVKARLVGEGAPERSGSSQQSIFTEEPAVPAQPATPVPAASQPETPGAAPAAPVRPAVTAPPPVPTTTAPVKESPTEQPVTAAPAPSRVPIRPPLAAGGGVRAAGPHAPAIPIPARTIAAHPAPAPQAPPAPPVAPPPAAAHPAPAAPAAPVKPAPVAHPAPAAPAKPAAPAAPAPPAPPVAAVAPAPPAPVPAPPAPPAPAVPAPPVATPPAPAAPAPPVQAAPPAPAVPAAPAAPAPPVQAAPPAPAVPAAPAAPAPPLPRPAAPQRPAEPERRTMPAAPRPAPSRPPQPQRPAPPRPGDAPLQRNAPIAPRGMAPGTPRPGQIISGPRQPMPGGEIPRPPVVVPGAPRPPAAPQMPRPQAPPPRPQPGAGQPTRPPLAGQPVARPVVPPRADILARLQQQNQPNAAPGQPAAPRPGQPTPGQPIYPGARRSGPGQPSGRPGPGAPGPGGRPMRGRGPHPTAPVLEPPPPTTTDAGRRDAGKKRGPQHGRERDNEGKLKSFGSRKTETVLPVIDREITISEGLTVKELSEKLGVKAGLVIKALVDRKIFATINQTLDTKLAEDLSRAFGASVAKMSYEEESVQVVDQTEVEGDLATRPPVVTIMGHVDHGKTSLLDAIREANVAGREAGGITQHIGAYHVEINDRKIVFIDTPGHEAFTRMRARGSKVTDIVVLVVAADDGVMPQTREAIDHARAAKVPLIVAVNKIDKGDAQPERVKQQLTELGLMPEEWGGETPFVMVSAKQKQNLELLLEMILLVADMQELKGNPNRPAVATVLEAKLDRGRGPVATMLMRNGTLHVGDHYLCGSVFGRVRMLYDDRGNQIREAGPSMPVEVVGLESLPDVGDTLQVVTDLAKARQIAEFREQKARETQMAKTRITLDMFHAQLREGETKELNIILKADVGGTAEVLSDTLQKLSTEKVSIRVISAGVGAITETDVNLAAASDAVIIGFNVRPERKATESAELEKVDIRLHTIIYELTDEIKKAMVGMLEPVYKEVYKGRAEVRDTFRITKVGTVAGSYIQDGVITRECQVRLLRDNVVVFTGKLDSLKRFKNDVSEVKSGLECGIALAGYNDIKPGDIIEGFVKEKMAPDLGA